MMTYRFENFEFDPEVGLSRSGEPIPMEPMAVELLHYLLRENDRIVTRDELNERLWDGRIVSDAALSTQVRAVRRALGDDREQQKFIKTYPRRGFRFIAAVEAGDAGETPDHVAAAAEPRGGSAKWFAVAALALIVLNASMFWLADEESGAPVPPTRVLSIAVLPFDNLSGDSAKNYLADAFTEDLVTDLSRIRDAFVISRSTTFTYRGKDVDAASVAAELGVRYILEGSLRVDGDKVRINAQLIDGETNAHLWADRFERNLSDLFSLRDNVTGRIASVLRAELRVADEKRQDPKATKDSWDYALRGNVILYNHERTSDYQEAHALLNKAVDLDPAISSAWTGLSFVHFVASLRDIPGVSSPDSARKSLDAARKAVEVDPMNAEPYWLVGAGYARTGQPEMGMAACETAMDLNPNMDCGHVCAGLVHMANGAPEKAVPFFRYALKLNPRFRPFTKEKYLGVAYLQIGQNDLAIEALNRALAKAPNDTFANLALAAALALDKKVPEARKILDRHVRSAKLDPPSIVALRKALGWMGPKMETMLEGLRYVGLPEG